MDVVTPQVRRTSPPARARVAAQYVEHVVLAAGVEHQAGAASGDLSGNGAGRVDRVGHAGVHVETEGLAQEEAEPPPDAPRPLEPPHRIAAGVRAEPPDPQRAAAWRAHSRDPAHE